MPDDNSKTNRDDLELSAYLDGELRPSEQRRVERRLATDPGYAERLAGWERARAMMLDTVEQPAFHARLLHNFYQEERRAQHRRTTWLGGALAAVAMLVAVVLGAVYFGGRTDTAGPAAAPDPPIAERAPEAPAKEPSRTQAAAKLPETPLKETKLPLKLTGTVTGDAPVAILVNELTGRSAGYAPGDEVVEGVTVAEVNRGSVTLDAFGERVTLGQRKVVVRGRKTPLEGRWEVYELREGVRHQFVQHIEIVRDGALVLITADGETYPARARLMGRNLELTLNDPDEGLMEMAGEFSPDYNECRLTVSVPWKEDVPIPNEILLVRVPEAVARCQQAWQDLVNATGKLAKALRSYNKDHDGAYPDTLEALVPGHLESLAFLGEENLNATLTPGMRAAQLPAPGPSPAAEQEPAATLANRWQAYERKLASLGWEDLLLHPQPVLTLRTESPVWESMVTARGFACFGTPEQTVLADLDEACIGVLREADANQLKQLGLVIKMFANENNNLTPPGWLSVYPEYLTGPGILTSPKDPPGTDSYALLFPAMDLDAMLAGNGADMENPAGGAKAQSELPVVVNRSDWPGEEPGRNVLFWDGHVEYVPRTSATWSQRLEPLLTIRGVR